MPTRPRHSIIVFRFILLPLMILALGLSPASAQDDAPLEPVGTLGGFVDAATVVGDHVFAGRLNSLVVLERDGLQQVASMALGDFVTQLAAHETRLVVMRGTTLEVLDVADPLDPTPLGSVDVEEVFISGLAVAGDHAYLAVRGQSLVVVDLSDPSAPVVATTLDVGALDVAIVGERAYVPTGTATGDPSDNQLAVFDLSDPAAPTEQGSVGVPSAFEVAGAGDRAFVTGLGSDQGLTIVDATDLANPTIAGTFGAGSRSFQAVAVREDRVYLGEDSDLVIVDVADATNPAELGAVTTGISRDISTITLVEEGGDPQADAAVLAGGELEIADVSDPANPSVAQALQSPETLRSMAAVTTFDGDVLYGVDGEQVWRFDVDDPTAPVVSSTVAVPDASRVIAQSFRVVEDGEEQDVERVLVTDGDGTLRVFDYAADPTDPEVVGTYETTARIHKMQADVTSAYVLPSETNRLEIVDLDTPVGPAKVGELELQGEVVDLFLEGSSDRVFVAVFNGIGGLNGVEIVDVSNPGDPRSVGFTELSTTRPSAVWVKDDLLYVANPTFNGGGWFLNVYDVSDPANPDLLRIDGAQEGPIWDVAVFGNTVVATLPDLGFRVFEIASEDPASFDLDRRGVVERIQPREMSILGVVPAFGNLSVAEAQGAPGSSPAGAKRTLAEKAGKNTIFTTSGSSEFPGTPIESSGVTYIERPPPGEGEPVTLTMQVEPAEAANAGCTTVPSPGPHEVARDSEQQVEALETANCAEAGWNFKEWTGDASGSSTTTSVTMDGDKEAIATFVRPELTLGLASEEKLLCPPDEGEEVDIATATLSANEVDDWDVQQISFTAQGNGRERDLQLPVTLDTDAGPKDGTVIIESANDDVIVGLQFPLGITVKAGETFTMRLPYAFAGTLECGLDENREYGITASTDQVAAEPVNFDNGIKLPPTALPSASTTVACVHNETKGFGRATILDGVAVAAVVGETTEDDVIGVCPGTYEEEGAVGVDVPGLTIHSFEGPDRTTVRSEGDLFVIDAENVTIQGFHLVDAISAIEIRGGGDNALIGVSESAGGVVTAKQASIERNVISGNTVGVSIDNLRSDPPEGIQLRGNYIGLNKAGTEADPNSIGVRLEENVVQTTASHTIIGGTDDGAGNVISGNESFGLLIEEGKSTTVQGNIIGLNAAGTEAIPNGEDGVFVAPNPLLASRTTIGGTDEGAGNVISGNGGRGLLLDRDSVIVQGNIIGLNAAGTEAIPNGEEGVRVRVRTIRSTIGGPDEGARNVISGNNRDGILDLGRNTIVQGNYIGLNAAGDDVVPNSGNGVTDDGVGTNTLISRNRIVGHDTPPLGENHAGIFLDAVTGTRIVQNTIRKNDFGILANRSEGVIVRNNVLRQNDTAVRARDGSTLNLTGNTTSLSLDFFTGIHLSDASGTIRGNRVANNAGGGIVLDEGATATVHRNTIAGNDDVGLRNDTETVVDARGNFWGDASGPSGAGPGSGDAVSDGVNFADFLAEPVDAVVAAGVDTIHVPAGETDSVDVFYQHLTAPNAGLDVSLTDERGSLQGPTSFTVTLEDSVGARSPVRFQATGENVLNTVRLTATAQQNADQADVDSFVVATFEPELARIAVTPDSVVVQPGAQLQLSAQGFHQFGGTLAFTPQWSATSGTVDENGLFTAGEAEDEIVITATDPVSGIQGQTRLRVTGDPTPARIAVRPDTVSLRPREVHQFQADGLDDRGFGVTIVPAWSATGGTIDEAGFYEAGEEEGTFTVTATDTLSQVQGQAVVQISGTPIPVELTSLEGVVEGGDVLLTWQTVSETNNAGFEVHQRAKGTAEWTMLAFIEGAGTTSEPQRYRHLVTGLTGGVHLFRLKQVDVNGTSEFSSVVSVDLGAPKKFALHGAYPNPSGERVTIPFDVARATKVRLDIYDVLGRRVHVLVDQRRVSGRYTVRLNTTHLATGTYFYRIQMGDFRDTKRLVVVR